MEERVHRLLFLRALNYNLSVSVSLLIPLCAAPLVVGTGNFVFLVAEMHERHKREWRESKRDDTSTLLSPNL